MEKKLYDSDTVTLSYFQDEWLIHITWKKNADTSEYRNIFNTIIEFSAKKKVKYVLSDMREEGLVKPEDLQWMEIEVLKKAVEHGVLKIALVAEDTIFSNIYAETIKRKLRESPIDVRIFQDDVSAKAWLLTGH